MNRVTLSRPWMLTAAALAALMAIPAATAKDKKDANAAASPVIAKVNGEDVTKAQFDEVLKANQRFYDLTSETVRTKLKGKPLTDYLFREEIVKVRAVAQKNAEALPAMKAALEQVQIKLNGGTDFAEVAKDLSQEKASAERGGSLGTEPQGFFEFVPPFNHVALSLKQGEVSEPVLTIFGYHIVKVDKIFPPMEMKPKRVLLRHILIRYPGDGADPRQESEQLTADAKVEITDTSYCKKLPSFCAEGAGS
jgi:hypothetical protein